MVGAGSEEETPEAVPSVPAWLFEVLVWEVAVVPAVDAVAAVLSPLLDSPTLLFSWSTFSFGFSFRWSL